MSRQLDSALDAAYSAYAARDAARAEALCAQILRKAPRNDRALHLLGRIRLEAGDAAGAVTLLQKAAKARPADAALCEALSMAQLAAGDSLEARRTLERAIRLERTPRAELLFNLAVLLERERRDEDAAKTYTELLARFPDYHDAWINLGVVQERLERNADAIRSYERARAIEPDSVHALANLGKVLRAERRLIEAKAACLRALDIDPASSDARVNLAAVLAEEGDAERARAEYDKALERDPQSPDTHYSHAALALALGDFDRGWREYAWRPTRLRARASGLALDDALPACVEDRDIVVLGEQGLGDELFFLRYARELAARGARVHVQCDARLAAMVGRSETFGSVFTPDAAIPHADHVVVAGDLPLMLGRADVPPPLSLVALDDRRDGVRTRLAALGPPPYIGLTWRAGTAPARQRGRPDRALYKAVPFDVLANALDGVPGTLIALQREPEAGEIARLASCLAREVHDLSHANDDLEEMLALLAQLDEYVGVSNTNMHLRAGLGRGARVLVPNPPEWRWMWSGARTPWFPAFHVYRERPADGWAEVARALAGDLAAGAE